MWSCSLIEIERKDLFSKFFNNLLSFNIDLVFLKFAFRGFCILTKKVGSRKYVFR